MPAGRRGSGLAGKPSARDTLCQCAFTCPTPGTASARSNRIRAMHPALLGIRDWLVPVGGHARETVDSGQVRLYRPQGREEPLDRDPTNAPRGVVDSIRYEEGRAVSVHGMRIGACRTLARLTVKQAERPPDPVGLATRGSGPPVPRNLADALRDIDETEAAALEDGFPVPSGRMLADTATLLRRLHGICPLRYSVYPSSRGDMVIYARPELGRAIMVVLYPDGRVRCSACAQGHSEPVSFGRADSIPDDTLRKAVVVMGGQGRP